MDGQPENILPIAEAVICHRIRSGLCDNEEQPLEQLEDVEHWKIQHAIFNVVFCSVFSSNSFSLLLRKTLYCALQKLRDCLSRSVFNWCWDQEAVVHGQFRVACMSRTMTKAQL